MKILQTAKVENLEERLAIGAKIRKENDLLSAQFKKALILKYHEEKKKNPEYEKEDEMKNLLQAGISRISTQKEDGSLFSQTTTMAGRTNLALDFMKQLKEAEVKKRIFKSLAQKMRETIDQNKLQEVRDLSEDQFAKDYYEWRSKQNWLFKLCLVICLSRLFQFFITLCILANTYILALDAYPGDPNVVKLQSYSNWFFFVVFLLEMLVKLVGIGTRMYFRDNFNTFDAIIVMFSVVDVVFSELGSGGGSGAVLALRAFRLLRVFKLAKSWKKLQDLLLTMTYTLKEVSSFSLLLTVFIFIYSLLGMNLYGYNIKFKDGDVADKDEEEAVFGDQTFNTFMESFLSVFIIINNEGWSAIFINSYRTHDSVIAAFYFLSLIIFGDFMMLNLFLAILL